MRIGLNTIAVIAAASSLISVQPAAAACAEPDFLPFQGDVKVICAIDWREAGENDSAMFVPLGGDLWAGWIHSGSYTVRSIEMLATTNSCNGLSLVGRVDDFLYRIFIEAESSTILVNLVRDDTRLNDQGHGDCRIVDEESYSLSIHEEVPLDEDTEE